MLGATPSYGRNFLDEEDKEGHGNVVILSNGLWKRRFASDPNIIGQQITLSASSHTVIGVMPASFGFPDRETELWAPMAFTAQQAQQHGAHYISVIGRLKPGASVEQARTEMTTIAFCLGEATSDTHTAGGANV